MKINATQTGTAEVRAPAFAALALSTALLLDQLSKHYVFATLGPGEEWVMAPVLSFRTALNPGIAFGLAEGSAPWLLATVGLVLSCWLTVLAWRAKSRLIAAARGVAVGGALGNVIDRIRFGAVRDFIDAHWRANHWPNFNMADVFVVCGILMFVALSGRESKAPRRRGE